MNTEAGDGKQTAHAWIDGLSKEQLVAVQPLFAALHSFAASCQPDPPATIVGHLKIDDSPALVPDCCSRLEAYLQRALEANDPTESRDCMSACLDIVRAERARYDANTPRRTLFAGNESKLVGSIESTASSSNDPTTGLPGRSMFEQTLTTVIQEGRPVVLALFVVERLVLINKRFGRTTGDEILLFVAQHLAQELPDSSSLSRWSGPAFAAFLDPGTSIKKTEMQVRAIASKQVPKTIESGGRSIMLPISCSCMIDVVDIGHSADALFSTMDDFILKHQASNQ